MITQHELWEKLIFSSNGALCNHNLATRVLDRFPGEVELRADEVDEPRSRTLITLILLNEAERVIRTSLDLSNGSHTHGFELWLTERLQEMLASVPDALVKETEQLVYDELEDPEELPVKWNVPSVVR